MPLDSHLFLAPFLFGTQAGLNCISSFTLLLRKMESKALSVERNSQAYSAINS